MTLSGPDIESVEIDGYAVEVGPLKLSYIEGLITRPGRRTKVKGRIIFETSDYTPELAGFLSRGEKDPTLYVWDTGEYAFILEGNFVCV